MFRRLVVVLVALALCVPAMACAQTQSVAQSASGVSTQPPVSLDGEDSEPKPAAKHPPASHAGELPNTGSDPRLLFGVGVAMTLLGVGLRLRTADADLY
jgi:LPXTG-motif cell wall-anchored protein